MEKKNIIRFLIVYMFFSFINLRNTDLLVKQFFFYVVGFILLIIINKNIKKYISYIYIIFNALLLYLLLFGKAINGSKAWINLPFISFQPSEFMKIILIIYLSVIANKHSKYRLKCFIITLIPSILTFLEPDTGNVLFYLVILAAILIYKEDNIKKYIKPMIGFCITCVLLIVLCFTFKDYFINIFGYSMFYRIERILSLFDNSSYQLNRALIGMGTGHLFGSEYIVSIPYETTDFAFSYLVSNVGYFIAIGFLIFNMSFDYYLINGMKYSVGVDKLILFVFIVMKLVQESIHILMNIGLFPITGITLPFVSYGGSSLITYFIILAYLSSRSMDMGMGFDKLDKDMVE